MNRLSTLVAAVAVVGALAYCRPAPAEEWADHLKVSAKAGDEGQVNLVLEATDGWYVNTAYPGTKVVLDSEALEKNEIKKDEAKFEEPTEGDKAKRVRFEAKAKDKTVLKSLEGTYKTVVCSKTTCSPPFKSAFKAEIDKTKGDS